VHIHTRNINTGFRVVVETLMAGRKGYDGVPPVSVAETRAGRTIRFDEPMTITFTRPTERVLFNTARDVNPFSVLYESLWVLAGRNDVAPLSYYTKRMVDYSDDGSTWYGAYGRRWRNWADGGFDQLELAAELLRADHNTRRIVLTMWDPVKDLAGQTAGGKDYPCNTHVYAKIKRGRLNITVCNRSNDTVWGLFGTNAVVFSFLQEYLAAKVGVGVGEYHHMSDDLHVYDEPGNPKVARWEPEKWLAESTYTQEAGRYGNGTALFPLVKDSAAFERELPRFVEEFKSLPTDYGIRAENWTEPFLRDVARPAFGAYAVYKTGQWKREPGSSRWHEVIAADDWRTACTGWLERRRK